MNTQEIITYLETVRDFYRRVREADVALQITNPYTLIPLEEKIRILTNQEVHTQQIRLLDEIIARVKE